MLNFFYGTELEKLAEQLFSELDENPLEDPLDKEIFVVQNNGIGQWLSLRMAEQDDGIAANLKFEFPSERIWSLIRQQNDEIPQTLPSDRGPMTWTLMELFEHEAFLGEFENLRHYIEDDNPNQQLMRSWKLASKVSDVFDQYLIYRPQMILDWEQQKLHTQSVEAEKWQMRLWNKLISYWEDHYDGEHLHRARLLQNLWDAFDQDEIDKAELPQRISVFGISSASEAFIDTMVKLSDYTHVNFYQLSVDPSITKSGHFEHPILQSLGDEGAKFMAFFNETSDVDFEFVGGMDSAGQSLFATVQGDLKRDTEQRIFAPIDESIQVHNCHSPMREVEVLYDQLLAILDENPELSPDEILIMMPDIETYAPIIEAVFGTPDHGQPDIPYAIADRGIEGAHPATKTFIDILQLCESRFKVTDVLDLLDSEPIQQTFEFSDDELNRIEQWVADNRIRWGIDGQNRKKMGLPESDHFTWQAGLRRILLGYMMRPSEDDLYEDVFAYNEVESSDDADLAGRLSVLLHRLFDINRAAEHSRTPTKWQSILNSIVDDFFPDSRDYFWEINKIREAISTLAENSGIGGYDHPISFSIIRRWLTEQLQSSSTGGGRIGRGVTFSSLMPMRSIPFKVIGMIGMSEGTFPQSKIPIEFDLMQLDSRRGDPVQSEEQRYLFLENLLSARTHLYFSYVGQSNRQDSDFPSSVVLKEFLDYLEQHYGIRAKDLITKHRLQAFSPTYFADENYFSYSQTRKQISQRLVSSNKSGADFFKDALPEPDEEWSQLSITDFISFFQHPPKYLLQNRLGIYLRDEDIISDDREPFELDKLSGYQINQELLDRYLKEQSLEEYRQVIQSRDMLPEGWSGAEAYQQKVKEVQTFGDEIKQRLDEQPLDDIEVDIEINGFRILGKLKNIYRGAQMDYRFGKAKPKYLIDFWIRHLLFQLVKPENHPGKSMYFSWEDDLFEAMSLPETPDAKSILSDLLGCYQQGLTEPLPLFCKSSYAFGETVYKKSENVEDGKRSAKKEWDPNWEGAMGEKDDTYYKLVTDGVDPFDEEFVQTAKKVWAPFFEALLNQGER